MKIILFTLSVFIFLASPAQAQEENIRYKRNAFRFQFLSPAKNALAVEYEYRLKENIGLTLEGGFMGINESTWPSRNPEGGYGIIGAKVYSSRYTPVRRDKKNVGLKIGGFLGGQVAFESFSAYTVRRDSSISFIAITSFDRQVGTAFITTGVQCTIRQIVQIETGFGLGYAILQKLQIEDARLSSWRTSRYYHGNLYDRNSGFSGRLWISLGIVF